MSFSQETVENKAGSKKRARPVSSPPSNNTPKPSKQCILDTVRAPNLQQVLNNMQRQLNDNFQSLAAEVIRVMQPEQRKTFATRAETCTEGPSSANN